MAKDDVGKCLTDIAEALIREDNRKCPIALTKELAGANGVDFLYREEIQRNKNKFCTRQIEGPGKGCGVTHRNGNKEKVKLHQSSILVTIPGKDMAFVQPIGSSNNVSSEDLNEWLA